MVLLLLTEPFGWMEQADLPELLQRLDKHTVQINPLDAMAALSADLQASQQVQCAHNVE